MARKRFTIKDLLALAPTQNHAVLVDEGSGSTTICLGGSVQNPDDKVVVIWADGFITFKGEFAHRNRTPREAAKHLGLRIDD